MYEMLVHTHSGLRWIVLLLMLMAIIKGFSGWNGQKKFSAGDKKVALFAMVSFHTQFLIGLILYFVSPVVTFSEGFMKIPVLRFYAVEHISLMVLAMIFITIGYSKSKKAVEDQGKFRKIAIWYLLTLILVLAAIPWPFRESLGGGWF